ncbi:MAG: CotH kinase family protein [Clostridia bacterium]|nr:CotH kinase family protein [Clostridia bacterium]
MKKRFNVFILLVIICVLSLTFAFAACNSDSDGQDTVKDLELVQGHEHKWDAGVVTTSPTCITPGVITYSCENCDAQKKEPLDANGEHLWSDYSIDEDFHWRVCRICGEIEKHEHDFGNKSIESDANEIMECECGIYKTVGEFYSYKVAFKCDVGISSILVYDTQTYIDGVESTVAYARDSSTGKLLNDGEGQVNFEVVVAIGYKLKSVSVTPKTGYKNLKDPLEISRDNTYRITKITDELVVTVETEIDFLELPVMVINTQNSAPILDKENYVTCNVSVLNAEQEYCFEGESAGIRGRGNTTWGLLKKPYKLKFNSKVDLFGNGKAKKWTLIANFADPSLARNYFTYSIASQFLVNAKYTTSVQNIELYLNGEYLGVYLVCEQNEVGSTRVDIDDNLVNDDGSLMLNTGYLLESDNAYAPYEGIEGLDFFRINGDCYAIKSPDVEDEVFIAHKEEFVGFIQNIMQTAVDSLNNLDNSYENFAIISNLLDIPSFVDGYLIDELTNTADGAISSFYLYYDNRDGKIYRGPIWDYDASCGNAAYWGINEPTYLRASLIFWYNRLLQFDEFKQLVKARLVEISSNSLLINFLDSKYDELMSCSNSFNRNFDKWDMVLGQSNLTHWNTEIIISITTWKEQVDYLMEWLKCSLDYMLSIYCSD